jgi:hypothetical protein
MQLSLGIKNEYVDLIESLEAHNKLLEGYNEPLKKATGYDNVVSKHD